MRRFASLLTAAALLLPVLCFTPVVAAAQSTDLPIPFASPTPSLDHPRKVVLSLSERDPDRMNEVISNVGNIQRFYGADNVRIVLVVFGPGIHAVLKKDSPVRARIASLVAIGVDVLACDATLQTLHLGKDDVMPGVRVVPNGLPAIIELQIAGWIYARP